MQREASNDAGQTIFNDTSSAAGASIVTVASIYGAAGGQTIFNGTSTADHASITNDGAGASTIPVTAARQLSMAHQLRPMLPSITEDAPGCTAVSGLTIFNDTSTAGHATITNRWRPMLTSGTTIFTGSSTADSAILIANGGGDGAVRFLLVVLRRVAPRG